MKIGVIGGGQLGRMLALQGADLGFEVHIYSEHSDDPAAQVTRFWHQGKIGEQEKLNAFFQKVDVVTFESEFIPPGPVAEAVQRTKVPVRPAFDLIALLSDRATQKDLLIKNKVPTADFVVVSSASELENFFRQHKKGMVGKQRLFGYDGYGTFILKSSADLQNFLQDHGGRLNDFIFEPIVPFRRELAISLARDGSGHVIFLPLVEWKARDKKCHWVKGPAKHKALSAVKNRLKAFVNKTDYRGLITFELFDVGNGLLVNEVAPRVHNSAHYSLNGLSRDQFQLHLLAVATDTLTGDPQPLTGGFAMVNLVGRTNEAPRLETTKQGFLHWYGKKENRPGRKMGHINAVAKSADEALKLALNEEKKFKL